MSNKTEVVTRGLSFGSVLAMIISWSVNKSILWAILHSLFSWFYVIYYWLIVSKGQEVVVNVISK